MPSKASVEWRPRLKYITENILKLNDSEGWILAFLFGYTTNWWQAAPEAVHKLLPAMGILVIADAAARGVVALKRHEFDSDRITKSLIKFFSYSIAVFAAVGIDMAIGSGYAAVIIVLTLAVYREASSVLENLSELGLDFPGIKKMLARWEKK